MKDKVLSYLFILFVSLFVILASVILVSNLSFIYYLLIDKLDLTTSFLEGTGRVISEEEIKESYKLLINFVVRGDSFKGLGALNYNELGYAHLEDVRNVFIIIKLGMIFSLGASLIIKVYDKYDFAIYHLKRLKNNTLYYNISLILLFIVILFALLAINFNSLFLSFHEIIFQDNFLMNTTENEFINILPSSYFLIYLILILSLISLTAIGLFIFNKIIIKKERSKMKVRLIAIDLDGTLLNDKKEIMPQTYNALRKASKMGVYVVLASGRPIRGMIPLIKELKLDEGDNYVINFNGSAVNKTSDYSSIFNCHLTKDEMLEIEEFAKKHHVHSHAFVNGECYVEEDGKYSDVEANINHITLKKCKYEDLDADCVVNKYMFADEPSKLNAIHPLLPQEFFEKYNIVFSAAFFLEFLNKKSNKGLALTKLAEYLNIPLEECMAIGDEENDLSMLEVAGVKVAMGNANKKLKDIATYITASNNDEGVGKAVEKLVISHYNESKEG